MKKYYLLGSIVLTGVLYAIFYSGVLPHSLLGDITGSYVLNYDYVCNSSHYCRSLGYPFLQNIFLFFQANASVFIFFQVFLFSFSCIFLATEFYKLTHQKILSYFLFFSIFLNPKVFKYTFSISEEGVFISLIAIVTALIIKFSRKKDINILLILSFIIGIAITIRPSGYAMLPLLFIILLFYWNFLKIKKVKLFLFLFTPVFLLITGESYLYHSNNLQDRETTLGVILLGKIPLIAINKPKNTQYPKLSKITYERGVKVREEIDNVDSFILKQYLRNVFNGSYQDLGSLYKPMSNEIMEYKKEFGSRDKVTSGLFKEYALVNPWETLKAVGLTFIGLWQLSEVLSLENRNKLVAFYQLKPINDKYHQEKVKSYLDSIKNHTKLAKITKFIMFLLLSATIILFSYGVLNLTKKRTQKITAIDFSTFIFPVMLNGYFLLIAIIAIVEMRFILTYWSVLMVIFFLVIHLLLKQFRKNVS